MPSRVRAIAEIGRLLGDPTAAEADQRAALELLVQDHADLDAVEAWSALWALAQLPVPALVQSTAPLPVAAPGPRPIPALAREAAVAPDASATAPPPPVGGPATLSARGPDSAGSTAESAPDLAALARDALLACGPQLMHSSEAAQQFLDVYQRWFGRSVRCGGHAAQPAFRRIERLALDDAELAARLAGFR
ncbi:hypothetical protein CCO03_00435 [Comamonas serinivorans]|uniref:Uncharacterized protein n=2 Tax=Comamonas serinivorans TaxID=1082851 RepID=A0A1Y0EIV5_9BURK|nr:hypothetical protein CCO03_00435 [Comamonas serinivorans]